jgi:hypothetical protein
LPSAKAAEEAKEIAIWVDDDELPISRFFVALSVPALLKRNIDGSARLQCLRVKTVDVRNLDLKVHPSPERVFQGSRAEPASGAIRLFEHQVNRSARQINEPLFGTFNAETEPKNVYVEADGSGEIGNVKFGNDGRRSGHTTNVSDLKARRCGSETCVRGGKTRQRGPVGIALPLSHSG